MPLYANSSRPVPVTGQYLYTGSPFTSSTSSTLGNGTLRVYPWWVDRAVVVTRVAADVTVVGEAGSKFRIGIYADNGNAYPGALLSDAGQIAGDSATVQELTISLALGAGLYWIGGAVQSAPTTQPTIRTLSNWTPLVTLGVGTSLPATGGATAGFTQTGVTAALPGTFTTSVTAAGFAARIIAKV